VTYALAAIDTLLGIALLVLVFLHSGKDAGLSTTFGGSGGSFGGTGVVQKNLDRLTVACGVAFFIVSIALVYLMK
jgi:preprotein translocase subunit SecG